MKRWRIVALACALCACRSANDVDTDAGTIVGNPGDGLVSVARSEGSTYVEAIGHLNHIELVDCAGAEELVDVDAEIDLLAPAPITLPSGRWCELNLEWLEGILVVGDGPDNSRFEATLELFEVLTLGDFTLGAEGSTVIEVGHPGWLSPTVLDLQPDTERFIDAPSVLHDELVDVATFESAAFDDADRDGEVSEEERDEGLISAGDGRADQPATPEEEDGQAEPSDGVTAGGCGTGQASWLFCAPLLLWGRRRT